MSSFELENNTQAVQVADTLRDAIQEFKSQQEKYSLFLSKSSMSTAIGPMKSERTLQNCLNVDVVLMPCSASTSFTTTFEGRHLTAPLKKIWPTALTAQYSSNSVRMGFIEEYGTLWKLVHKKDQTPGYRVYLQTAEVNETKLFLGPDLQLVTKDMAIIWQVKVASNFKDAFLETNQKNETERGIFIQLENVGTTSKGVNSSKLTTPEDMTVRPDNSFLTFKHTNIAEKCEAALDSMPLQSFEKGVRLKENENMDRRYFQMIGDKSGMDIFKSFVWEVVPDSWISNDLDFLEDFIEK